MEFKDLGNGRVIRQPTPRQAEPLQASAVDIQNLSLGAKAVLLADAIVGDVGDVASGVAQYSSINAAIAGSLVGARIFLLKKTWVENVSIDRQIEIIGSGYGSYINGTVTFTGTSDHSLVSRARISGNITFDVGSIGCILSECWNPTASLITDNGSGNYYAVGED